MKSKDSWFFQADIEREFEAFPDMAGELICVFESRESYVESFYSQYVPLPCGRFKTILNYVSWGEDFAQSRALIVRRRSEHFLSRAFRNRAAIELGRRVYISLADRRIAARRELSQRPFSHSDRILVTRDLVTRFLKQTSQRLLWCVRSIRYSERVLKEFGVAPYDQRVLDNTRHFIRQAKLSPIGSRHDRPRMQSLTYVFGKRVVTEINGNINR